MLKNKLHQIERQYCHRFLVASKQCNQLMIDASARYALLLINWSHCNNTMMLHLSSVATKHQRCSTCTMDTVGKQQRNNKRRNEKALTFFS